MQQRVQIFVLVVGVTLAAFPISGEAQTKSSVPYLTEQDLTSERLIEALKPKPRPGVRGIAPVITGKPQCSYYQQQQKGRGVKLGQDVSSVAMNVTFAFNSAELTPEASRTLDKLGEALKSSELAICCFQIEGHTDSKGSDAYNLKLSERRAQSVVGYLEEHFSLDRDRLMAVGYGKRQPIADNDTDGGRQKNRRVQVVNLGYGKATE